MVKNTPKASYKECFVTFFDILGFTELLRSKDPAEIAEILSVFRAISVNGDLTETGTAAAQLLSDRARVEIVSDAIVRVQPNSIDPLTKMSKIFEELIVLKEIQVGCLRKGILVRGATTLGKMYVDDDLSGPVFGPALVEAYQMESREVIYPRIAIHEDVVARYRHDKDPLLVQSYHVDLDMTQLLLTQDGAGLFYIDYLRVNFDDLNWSAAETFDFLILHKKLIHDGLKAHHGSTKRKYSWLKSYHNKSIDQAIQGGKGSESDPEVEEVSISAWQALKIDD